MAGSFHHIINDRGDFIGTSLIDNLGDAYEALEECWSFIHILSNGDLTKLSDTHIEYLKRTNGNWKDAQNDNYITPLEYDESEENCEIEKTWEEFSVTK